MNRNFVNRRIVVVCRFVLGIAIVLFAVLTLAVAGASAQTSAYGQTTLVAEAPGGLNNVDGLLGNPASIAFAPRQPFFIAARKVGQARIYDATGTGVFPFAFRVPPSAADPTRSRPSAIVFNPAASDFILNDIPSQFVVVGLDGTVSGWGIDAVGDIPVFATLGRDDSFTGAVYTGVTIVNPDNGSNFLAVADFHNARIQTFDTKFGVFVPQGSFIDRNLPAGFAPFNIQQIGTEVFVLFALQDEAKQNPVAEAGNGIVDVFDQQGNFLRRFATGASLNAPWGITVASANFGPFSNDILIGNFGDGTISAFDPANGFFKGQLTDSTGAVIANSGIRALTFRSDGFADPNTLFFTAGSGDGQSGLFGAITHGLVSATQITIFPTPIQIGSNVSITISVAGAPGNPGTPTGNIVFQVGAETIFIAPLANGVFAFDDVLSTAGTRIVRAAYTGDATFLPSASQVDLQVMRANTTTTLSAPATARLGDPVTFTANSHSAVRAAAGEVDFLEGATQLGSAQLDVAGNATLTITTLAAGTHTVTAVYAGNSDFLGSTSAPVSVNITNTDFSLAANPPSAAVVAGQSTNFMLTVTPAGGFAGNVTFSCAPVTGITCTFNPPVVTPANGAASTTLTVATYANVAQFGSAPHPPVGAIYFFGASGVISLAFWKRRKFQKFRSFALAGTAVLAIAAISAALVGCGGAGIAPAGRGTASITVTAQSGNISHSTNVNVTVQ